VPAGKQYLSELASGGLTYHILFTHWHWDHILGLTLSPPTFIDQIGMALYGPRDNGVGPKEMIDHLFKRPYFPVDAKRISHKIKFTVLENFDVHVVVVHPEGGFTSFNLDRFKTLLSQGKQLPMGGGRFSVDECLVIRMAPTHHGNATAISYRFEERPTGKVFVFATDHEDTKGIPADLRTHLSGADLLVIDGQYPLQRYMTQTAGFGHGTPRGVVELGIVCSAKRLGITHHDPGSTDEVLKGTILREAREALAMFREDANFQAEFKVGPINLTDDAIVICHDYEEFELV
jgi:ribonuclease BN (tRNA processing enzyme)